MRFRTQLFWGTSALLMFVALLPAFLGSLFLPAAYSAWEEFGLRGLADQITRSYEARGATDVWRGITFHHLNYAAITDESMTIVASWQNPKTPLHVGSSSRRFGPPPIPAGELSRLAPGESRVGVHVAPGLGSKVMSYSGRLRSGEAIFLLLPLGETERALQSASLFLVIAAIVGLILAVFVTWAASSRLTRPLEHLVDYAGQLERLHLDSLFVPTGSDEIRQLGGQMDRMARALSSSLRQLEDANRHLEGELERRAELDAMRRDFIANASHELKTPIALIRGYAEGLSQGVASTPEARAQYIEVILDETVRLNRHVQELLELSLWESGQSPLRRERFDLTELVDEVTARFAPRFREVQMDVKVDTPKSLELDADRESLGQALSNFLTNAIDHGRGPGVVRVSLTAGSSARLEVANPGAPLPDAAIERVWESYYKTDASRQRTFSGAGLGLSIVKRIIEVHGGSCGCRNQIAQPGEAASVVFWWEIPLQPSRHEVEETVNR